MLQISSDIINFSNLNFLFRFLPIFIFAYYAVSARLRPIVLLAGSLVFYALGDLKSLPILIVCVMINALFGKLASAKKKIWFYLIVILDAAFLLSFKYVAGYGTGLILPIGISFFTFRMISYQVDLYRGNISKWPGIIGSASYFVMFPQLMSGPIMRYSDFEENDILTGKKDRFLVLKDRLLIYAPMIEEGLCYFTMGFAMKVILADHLAMMWNEIGTIGYESISTPLAWTGVLCYSLNLYFDFWGYSLMAGGIGVMLGFPFIRNFDQPYSSSGVSEFYRRWHMTLGTWFRDYVYIPLGGSRKSKSRTILNLLAVWVLTGIWHGVTVNFLLWSMLLVLMIVMEKFVWSRDKRRLAIVGRIHVLLFVPITWVIFALHGSQDLVDYLLRLFGLGEAVAMNPGDFAKIVGKYWPFLLLGLLFLIPGVYSYAEKKRQSWPFRVLLLILFWICAALSATRAGNPFMYFSF